MKTHRCFLTVLAFFSCAILNVAQQPTVDTSVQASAPLREYFSTEGRFKVLLCETPKEINEMVDSSSGKIALHMLICPSTVAYFVSYVDYAVTLETPDLVKKALDNAREGSLAQVAEEHPSVTLESDISIEGHPGRFLRYELKGDAVVRARYAIVGNRLYTFGVGSPKEKPKIVDASNDYERLATRFFESFKLVPALEADKSATWKEFSSPDGRFKVEFPGTPQQSSHQAGTSETVHVAQYQSAAFYSAMYFDYSETPKGWIATIELLDSLRLGELDELAKRGVDFNLVSESSISVDGNPGRLLVLEIANNQIYRRKTVLVKNRVYALTATAPRDDPKIGNYESLALRFINSFSLMDQRAKQ